jgi:ferredoxin
MRNPWRVVPLTLIAAFIVAAATVAVMHKIDTDLCTQCGLCIENCPEKAISVQTIDGEEIHVIDQTKCTQCGKCVKACPVEAIKVLKKGSTADKAVDNKSKKSIGKKK